jgi:type VI protein secretion system component VasK
MIDIFDIIAFGVFAILIAAAFVVIVGLGSLPGRIAQQRGHPQAAAITAMSWLGLATGGILWLLAFVWAFMKPVAVPSDATGSAKQQSAADVDANARLAQMQSRIDALEATVREIKEQAPSTSQA